MPDELMKRELIALVTIVWMSDVVTPTQQKTLRELAREHDPVSGPLVVKVNSMLPPRSVLELLSGADLVVEGIINRSTSQITTDQTSLEMALDVAVTQVLFHDLQSIPVMTEAIRRLFLIVPGGELEIDGRPVVVIVAAFPRLNVAARYVLFLKKIPNAPDGTFAVMSGAYGVFEVVAGQVISLVGPPLQSVPEYNGLTVEAFGTTLRQMRPSSKK